jgi:hypothetical protein
MKGSFQPNHALQATELRSSGMHGVSADLIYSRTFRVVNYRASSRELNPTASMFEALGRFNSGAMQFIYQGMHYMSLNRGNSVLPVHECAYGCQWRTASTPVTCSPQLMAFTWLSLEPGSPGPFQDMFSIRLFSVGCAALPWSALFSCNRWLIDAILYHVLTTMQLCDF